MKKAMVIIRLGTTTPLTKEMPIIIAASGSDLEKSIGGGIQETGLISMIYTDWSPDKIIKAFAQVAEVTEDILPLIVFELNNPAIGINLNHVSNFKQMAEDFLKSIEDTQNEPAPNHVVNLSLDELLDLVNEKGLANLTAAELTRLKDLTK